MARRRVDDEPGLIDRVRWRNVGRLVLLVAVLVLAVAAKGCGRREQVLPPEVRVAPPRSITPAPVPPATPSPAPAKRKRARRERVHRRPRKRRRPARPVLRRFAPPARPAPIPPA